LTASLARSIASGLQGQISYTWSHALDLVSNGGLTSFAGDSVSQISPFTPLSLTYGSSDYDVRHNLTLDFLWNLPVRQRGRALHSVLGGWSFAAKANAHSGTPFTVFNSSLTGSAAVNLGSRVFLADLLDPNVHRTCGHAAIAFPCLTAAQFATAASQTDLGNISRNSFRGPGYFSADSAIYKEVAIGEKRRLRFGVVAFNVLNHPNFLDPNADVSDSGFGLISSTAIPPSGPYGFQGGPTGRALVLNGKLMF
jgi:hypothetical protein